jgi:hypothetical protein
LALIRIRQKYTTYNTMEAVRAQLSKEINLIKNMVENFGKAKQSKATQDQFVSQIIEWLRVVNENTFKAS